MENNDFISLKWGTPEQKGLNGLRVKKRRDA